MNFLFSVALAAISLGFTSFPVDFGTSLPYIGLNGTGFGEP